MDAAVGARPAKGVVIVPSLRVVRRGDLDGESSEGGADERSVSVTAVIPAYNEEEGIDWVLHQIPSWVSEVVLVDGLSTDRTEALARGMKPDLVIVHQHRPGKGAALRAGFAAARGDIIVMLDADGSTDPREIGRFVGALLDGAEFVKGSRTLPGGGSEDFTRIRQAGNRGFVLLVNLLFGTRFTDLCYGYCAFWSRHLPGLALETDGFEIESELILNAVRAGLRIGEVPSFELLRRGGSSNLRAFSDGRRVLRTVLRKRFRRRDIPRPGSEIMLEPRDTPSTDCSLWRPAGTDRRRKDRRRQDPQSSGYTGPERRRDQRRRRPSSTMTVYVATPAVEADGVSDAAAEDGNRRLRRQSRS
jgi:hypothetical protein